MVRARPSVSALASSLLAAAILTGCASMNDEARDPLEPLNRHIFAVNQAVDVVIVRPLAVTYRDLVPDPIKTAVNNFLNYLKSPVILANDLMQGEWKRAGETVERFVNNTMTLGLADIAAPRVPFHDEDFGQTLAVWGAGDGPYLVLPLIGPSNPRDALGIVVDWFIDPVYWTARNNRWDGLTYGRTAARVITARVDTLKITDDLERTSLDYYAALRDIYRQRRNDEIRNRATGPTPRAAAGEEKALVREEQAPPVATN